MTEQRELPWRHVHFLVYVGLVIMRVRLLSGHRLVNCGSRMRRSCVVISAKIPGWGWYDAFLDLFPHVVMSVGCEMKSKTETSKNLISWSSSWPSYHLPNWNNTVIEQGLLKFYGFTVWSLWFGGDLCFLLFNIRHKKGVCREQTSVSINTQKKLSSVDCVGKPGEIPLPRNLLLWLWYSWEIRNWAPLSILHAGGN